MKKIFIVDDERNIRELIEKYFKKEGYISYLFSNGNHIINELRRLKPDLIVLDIMMDGIDGLELCKNIRKISDVPIIFVSARGEDIDRIIGLEIGADDYLAKPFSPRELVIRAKNIFKRLDNTDIKEKSIIVNNLNLNPRNRELFINNNKVNLTNKEYELILYLLKNIEKPFKRDQLVSEIWGYDYFGDLRVVDDLIKRLRKKIDCNKAGIDIKTVWGYGYKIEKK